MAIEPKEVFEAIEKYDNLMVAYDRATRAFANVIAEKKRCGSKVGFFAELKLRCLLADAMHAADVFIKIYSMRTDRVPDEADVKIIMDYIMLGAEEMFGPAEAHRMFMRRIAETFGVTANGRELGRSAVIWFVLQNTKGERMTYTPEDGYITIMRNGKRVKVMTSKNFKPTRIGATIKLRTNRTGDEDTWTVDYARTDEIAAANSNAA
jgi:hypothetical protein